MRDRDVERAFRDERRRVWIEDARKGAPIVLALVAILAVVAAWQWSPRRFVETASGHAEIVQHVEREDGPPNRWLYIRLDGGGSARVYLPRAALYREVMRVEMRVTERVWFPGSRSYELVRTEAPD